MRTFSWVFHSKCNYELSSTLEKGFVLDCLTRAFAKVKPEMINSDQGSHFTNEERWSNMAVKKPDCYADRTDTREKLTGDMKADR